MILRLAVALAAALLYTGLGLAVSRVPPFGIDLAGRALAGEAPHLALFFTESCWWPALAGWGPVAILVSMRFPLWRPRVTYAIPTMLVAWQISDFLKNVFHRPRPEYWRLIHEPTFSYSSGHAMFAVLVYGLWAWFLWRSELPRAVRFVAAPVAALWACGIIWSRLALGAHYVTDLIGGVLLATCALALAAEIHAALSRRLAHARASS